VRAGGSGHSFSRRGWGGRGLGGGIWIKELDRGLWARGGVDSRSFVREWERAVWVRSALWMGSGEVSVRRCASLDGSHTVVGLCLVGGCGELQL
jgi:hypothetical protein